ncbi:nucleotide sugar dehydrogenase [Paenibacillus sp. IB182496]|uniref:Nucleotide sugar dehydrogenase n=1 Tax=Paenibacillus sabuli TaxID=2772509 RepID=A0A927BYB3_9BACL|nr:nucleotide sugar dehydrogenase [Paenibacillus sabuli]MBD2847553.1 nucleotide sugar dehydrogenase [Paenibacillus sabuli]
MDLFKEILEKRERISVIGLGYVGLPLAYAFSKKVNVIGFDLDEKKINSYKKGVDPTKEVGNTKLMSSKISFTSDASLLREAKFHIVAVPTPINIDKTPNLTPVEKASSIVGKNLVKNSIVVYESTVYPGVTEDICIPILERESGLKCGVDFQVGYSPERINPGDTVHTLENIIKIVSSTDELCTETISKIYGLIIRAGVYIASSIKVAEAAKVVENSQRDINIAFMNELAMVFDKMGIDTKEVIDAMNTKWNALRYYPGLVGGHCIGVDPYYFIYQAERLGYHSQIILSGRKINDGMSKFIADSILKQLILAGKIVNKTRVAILGITFKENCPDIRNTRVIDIISTLEEYGIKIMVSDPRANKEEVKEKLKIDLVELREIKNVDCIVIAVGHYDYKNLKCSDFKSFFKEENDKSEKIIIDVKSIYDKEKYTDEGFTYWRL